MFKIGRCSRCGKLKFLNIHGLCSRCNEIENRIVENDNDEMDMLTKIAIMDVALDHNHSDVIFDEDVSVEDREKFFEGGESGGGGASSSFELESDNSSNSNEDSSDSSDNDSYDSDSSDSDFSDSGSSSDD